MLAAGRGGRRAAAGEAGAADLPERERATGNDACAARLTMAANGLDVCRAGFAGRGTACARPTDATRSLPVAPRDKGLGAVNSDPRQGFGSLRARRQAIVARDDPCPTTRRDTARRRRLAARSAGGRDAGPRRRARAPRAGRGLAARPPRGGGGWARAGGRLRSEERRGGKEGG